MDEERRRSDIIILQSVARIEEKLKILEKHSKDIDEIKKILTDHRFQRIMINATRIGDQEEIMRILSDEYHGLVGFKILPEVLNEKAHKIKVKNELEKSLIRSVGQYIVQFSSKVLPIIIVTSLVVCAIVISIINGHIPLIK